jgi:glycerol-1-phosphate dehydrogenase [NAD(P)+]
MPKLIEELYGTQVKLWVLSDENTEMAAAARCKQLLSRFQLSSTILPAQPRPRTSPEIIENLSREAGSPELILAVGSGTISDIAKMVSLNLQVPNWCVMTAASVDAFSSGTSALKLKNRHKTEPARATEMIFADLEVLERAPELMFLSGVGDLLAKYLSYLDWKISALITGEYICEQTAELCLASARQAMEAVKSKPGDPRAAVRCLADASLLSGLAMQALSSSRPASSAEHSIPHCWEIGHTMGNPELELHGLLVGLSCRILLEGYQRCYRELENLDIDIEARLRALAAEPHWEKSLIPAIEPFRDQIRGEMDGQVPDEQEYRKRLENILIHRKTIRVLADGLLRELETAVGILSELDYPFRLSDYQPDLEKVSAAIHYVRFLRNRYSTFNLAHEIGAAAEVLATMDECLSALR